MYSSHRAPGAPLPLRLIALAVPLLLVGCASQTMTAEVGAESARLGADIAGDLNAASPVNLNDGTRYAAHRFCATGSAGAVLYRFEAPFDARLTLLDGERNLVGRSQSSTDGDTGLVLVNPPADACSLVIVSGADASAFGPYRLEAQAPDRRDTGALAPGESALGEAGLVSYPLRIDSPTRLDLELIDASASLGLSVVGEGFRDRALTCGESAQRLTTYLEAGDYEIRLQPGRRASTAWPEAECPVATADRGNGFQLLTRATPMSEGVRNGGPLRDGDVIQGVRHGERVNEYRLSLDEMSRVSVDLASGDFDTVLEITGEDTNLRNDDSANGTDSQLSSVLRAGDYRVLVKSFSNEAVDAGEYEIRASIDVFDGELTNQGTIEPNSSVEGLYSEGENTYSLTLEERSEVSIAVDSNAFDSMVELTGEDIQLSDDDSGGELNALLTALLEPGTYQVAVRAYSGGGVYQLSVDQSPATGRMQDEGELAVGDVVYGNLATGEALNYQLVVENGRSLRIDVGSSSVDTVLRVGGEGLALNDDDGGEGTNSRIEQFLPPGTYDIEVRDYSDISSGMIRLEITQNLSTTS